jgi:hypothetical protein
MVEEITEETAELVALPEGPAELDGSPSRLGKPVSRAGGFPVPWQYNGMHD